MSLASLAYAAADLNSPIMAQLPWSMEIRKCKYVLLPIHIFQYTKFGKLVLGLAFSQMMVNYDHIKPLISKDTPIILSWRWSYGVLVMTNWLYTVIWNQSLSSILNSTYWYLVLARVICCFSDDHVPSYQTNPCHPYWIRHNGIGSWHVYICIFKNTCVYVYFYLYEYMYPIPNTQ